MNLKDASLQEMLGKEVCASWAWGAKKTPCSFFAPHNKKQCRVCGYHFLEVKDGLCPACSARSKKK